MTNPNGSWIWYELLTTDADAAIDFYSQIIGWTPSKFPGGTIDYNIMSVGEDGVGGIMKNPAPTPSAWLGYVGVDDVDATVATIQSLGGKVHVPPMDLPGVGRMSMVQDPQGAYFYVMRGASPEASRAFGRAELGKASWNELQTTDDAAALAFYDRHFGIKKVGAMEMGEMGDYSFIANTDGGDAIGAVMKAPPGVRPGWGFYFRVPDIDTAKTRVETAGGTITHGPMEVPGGEMVLNAIDPHGVHFGLVAPGK